MKKRFISILTCVIMLLSVISVAGWVQHADAATYYWPVPGHTARSQNYHAGHKAIDISDGSINGAKVYAAIGGTVTQIYKCGSQHYGSNHDCNGFGTGLVIKGTDGRSYQYAHMQANSIPSNVYYGASVASGQLIGKVGTTGNSTGPHLHFSIATGNWWEPNVDPMSLSYSYNIDGGSSAISWGSYDCQPDSSNAFIYTKATASYKGTFTQAGAVIWDASGKQVASKTENINTTSSYLEVWYNITNEMGVRLNQGSNYKYQYWVIFNGTKYLSPIKSFTTSGVGKATLSVTKGDASTSTKITWTAPVNAKTYNLRLKKYNGSEYVTYKDVWGLTGTSYSLKLPQGDYSVYVDACNGSNYNASNTVYFSVSACKHTKTYIADKKKAGVNKYGYTGDKYCSYCNKKISSGTKIPYIKSAALSYTVYTYNGNTKTPAVKVYNSNGKLLTKGTHYTVKYASGRKYVGSYKVTITFKGNYTGTVSKTFKIKPPKTSLKSLKAGDNKLYAYWNKRTVQVDGYQLKYSRNSSFKEGTCGYTTIKKDTQTYKTISNLKNKKCYYVKIRTYKIVNGVTYYSYWSDYKYINTK